MENLESYTIKKQITFLVARKKAFKDWQTERVKLGHKVQWFNRDKKIIHLNFKRKLTALKVARSSYISGFLGLKTSELTDEAKKEEAQIGLDEISAVSKKYWDIFKIEPDSIYTFPRQPQKPFNIDNEMKELEKLKQQLKLILQKEKDKKEIEKKQRALERENKKKKQEVESKKRALERENKKKKQEVDRRKQEIESKKKAKDKLNKAQAKASSLDGKTRKRASSIKNRLDRSHPCPYCDNLLDDESHADHIYPVAKGGLSLDSNMVYVCVLCNQKKKDLTLSAFCRAYSLDRDQIEERLLSMGKDI